ncbi:MAG TPA: XrtA system polysaccharide deacetylase [Gammaproteobacteria bacterium]|nr:XrtA system polysaccharide deacetylase [Gammaproteobacteria bacterium]
MDSQAQPLNALTVDVEDWYHVGAFADRIDPAGWDDFAPRVGDNTRRLMELFERHDTKATFFILGWVAERQPELIREIAAAGHEIACHGWSHQLVYGQRQQVFRDETVRSKALLEDILGAPVNGYRAASYSITGESLWALDVLVEAGFEYDSSIFPVHHDRYGIPGGERWPHVIRTPSGAGLVEFPLSTARWLGMRLPIAGGGYFRIYPYALTRAGLGSINRAGKPFIFYLHPWEIDTGQPRMEDASWKSKFRHYTGLARCEPRLEQLLKDFRMTTCREVLAAQGLLPARAA